MAYDVIHDIIQRNLPDVFHVKPIKLHESTQLCKFSAGAEGPPPNHPHFCFPGKRMGLTRNPLGSMNKVSITCVMHFSNPKQNACLY